MDEGVECPRRPLRREKDAEQLCLLPGLCLTPTHNPPPAVVGRGGGCWLARELRVGGWEDSEDLQEARGSETMIIIYCMNIFVSYVF